MKSLNPRFDGAFLNSRTLGLKAEVMRLNPRFDGAFLNFGNALKRMQDNMS